jgi:hypothetical protein
MKLGNFLRTVGTARPVNPRPVALKIIGKDLQGHPVVAAAKAVFVFVDEDTRMNLRVKARQSLAAKYPGQDFADVLRDETSFQLLYQALRDAEPGAGGLFEPFAASVDELRSSLVLSEAARLVTAYQAFVEDEFPEVISDKTFRVADPGGDGLLRSAAV